MFLKRLLTAASAAALLFSAAVPAVAATAGVNADVSVQLHGSYVGGNDLGSVVFNLNQSMLTQFAAGTGSGNADKLFADTRTLTASSTESLDLAGVLTDPFGVTLTFVKVKAIYVKAAATNTNDVCVGGAASNAFAGPFSDVTDIVCLKPGAVLLVTNPAGWTVTAATGDLLKVANSAGTTSVTYDVIVIGASA